LETSLADEFYYLDKEGAQGYLDKEKLLKLQKSKSGCNSSRLWIFVGELAICVNV